MKRLVSIDPSLRGTGVAWFSGGELVEAQLLKATGTVMRRKWGMAARAIAAQIDMKSSMWPTQVVIEIPQIYKQSPGDPNDLIAVTLVAGALCETFDAPCTTVWPAEWKGQVPKDVHHPRIINTLAPSERTLLGDVKRKVGAEFHNVMDAVGIGLWYLKKAGERV